MTVKMKNAFLKNLKYGIQQTFVCFGLASTLLCSTPPIDDVFLELSRAADAYSETSFVEESYLREQNHLKIQEQLCLQIQEQRREMYALTLQALILKIITESHDPISQKLKISHEELSAYQTHDYPFNCADTSITDNRQKQDLFNRFSLNAIPAFSGEGVLLINKKVLCKQQEPLIPEILIFGNAQENHPNCVSINKTTSIATPKEGFSHPIQQNHIRENIWPSLLNTTEIYLKGVRTLFVIVNEVEYCLDRGHLIDDHDTLLNQTSGTTSQNSEFNFVPQNSEYNRFVRNPLVKYYRENKPGYSFKEIAVYDETMHNVYYKKKIDKNGNDKVYYQQKLPQVFLFTVYDDQNQIADMFYFPNFYNYSGNKYKEHAQYFRIPIEGLRPYWVRAPVLKGKDVSDLSEFINQNVEVLNTINEIDLASRDSILQNAINALKTSLQARISIPISFVKNLFPFAREQFMFNAFFEVFQNEYDLYAYGLLKSIDELYKNKFKVEIENAENHIIEIKSAFNSTVQRCATYERLRPFEPREPSITQERIQPSRPVVEDDAEASRAASTSVAQTAKVLMGPLRALTDANWGKIYDYNSGLEKPIPEQTITKVISGQFREKTSSYKKVLECAINLGLIR